MKTANRVALQYRVASRYRAARTDEAKALIGLLMRARTELQKWKAWSRSFDATLRGSSREGLPPGYVWQEGWVDFWEPFDPIERRLLDILSDIEDLGSDHPDLKEYTSEAVGYVEPPKGARIEDAIKGPKFIDHPSTGGSEIAYSERNLKGWDQRFSRWVDSSIRGIDSLANKVKSAT